MLPSKSLRAAWYSRVSTDAQAEAVTIDLQRDYAQRFFALHQDQLQLIGTYEDDGVSGSIPVSERPGGKRLLADARAGRFDVIVFYSFDRIVRSTLDLLQFHQMVQEHGIELRSATQPFDTTTAFGRAFMTLLAMVAELERAQIEDRTTRGRLRAVRNNLPPGGIAALGYKWEGGLWIINEEEARIVRMIFDRIAAGESASAVATWLRDHSIPTAYEIRNRGLSTWRTAMVCKIVRSATYRGVFHYNTHRWKSGKPVPRPESDWITSQVPRLVSDEVWYAANAVLTLNRGRSHSSKPRMYDYLLGGLVRCGICGLTYVGSSGSTERGYFYYRHPQKEQARGCLGPVRFIRAPKLEEIVWERVSDALREPAAFLGRLQQRLRQTVTMSGFDDQALEKKVAARSRVLRMLARDLVPEEEAEAELVQLDGEIRRLEGERDAAALDGLAQRRDEVWLLDAERLLAELRNNTDGSDALSKQATIRALVREVTVLPGAEGRVFDLDITFMFDV